MQSYVAMKAWAWAIKPFNGGKAEWDRVKVKVKVPGYKQPVLWQGGSRELDNFVGCLHLVNENAANPRQ